MGLVGEIFHIPSISSQLRPTNPTDWSALKTWCVFWGNLIQKPPEPSVLREIYAHQALALPLKCQSHGGSMIRCSTSPEQNQVIQFVALKSRILGGHLFTIRKRSSEITEPPAWTSDLKRLIQNIFRALALCMIQQGVQRRNKCLSFIKLPVEFDRRLILYNKMNHNFEMSFFKKSEKKLNMDLIFGTLGFPEFEQRRAKEQSREKEQSKESERGKGAEQRKGALKITISTWTCS